MAIQRKERRKASLHGLRVLIVDDVELDAKLMHIVLTGEGCVVLAARNTDAALALLPSFRPRMILMDLRLPNGNGLDLTRRIKAARETRDVLIVAVSNYEGKDTSLAAGCDGFIAKPIDVIAFPDQLRRVLTMRRGT